MRGELYSEQGKKKLNLFLHSFRSIFHISHYLIFHSYQYFYVIWLSSEWISAQISYKRNGVGDCMHNVSLHQILSIISHSYFAYFAFHYFLVLHAIFLSSCAPLYTCTVSHSIFSPSCSPLMSTCWEKVLTMSIY